MSTAVLGKKRDMDMTKGSIIKNLLTFAFPLLLGNLFQQLYNMVDTYVIGQTGVNEAYAAVGSVAPIINILIGSFMGLAGGVGVIISQNFGAKKFESVERVTHTAIILTAILSVVFTVLGIVLTPLFLNLMLRADANSNAIFPYAKQYLTIYFAGVSGLLFYNMGSGILRAIGDSNRPFYFLLVSAILNVIFDCVFVFGFNMGVDGVAYATIIAQGISAIITVITLFKTTSCVKLSVSKLKIDKNMLGKIFKIGTPSALQMAFTAFSNLFVMSYISNVNGDTTLALSGWTTYSKVDMIIFMPIQSIALAVTTFVGQNLGVNNEKRARKGVNVAVLITIIATVIIMIPIIIFAPYIASIFNKDAGVVEYATLFLRYITPFYLLSCFNQNYMSALRGAGNTKVPMIMMLSGFIGVRQLYLFIMSTFISNDPIPIGLSYPVGWLACMLGVTIYYFTTNLSKFRLVDDTITTKTTKDVSIVTKNATPNIKEN